MISDPVELCETEVCFLHIQLIGTNVRLPKNAQCSTRSGFWIFQISCKIGVLKQSQSALFGSVTHMTILFVFTCVMNIRNQSTSGVCHRLWSYFVMDRASLFTDQRISGLQIRAKHKHLRTIWKQTFDNSPTDFNPSSLKWWSSMHEVETL